MYGFSHPFIALRPNTAPPQIFSAPAPFGGWNPRDSLDLMPEQDAIRLENFFPESSYVRMRDGYAAFATGVGAGDVEFVYGHEDGTNSKLLAAGGGSVYNASVAGAATSLAAGFTSNRWQADTMNGVTILVNGADTPQSYDGAALAGAGLSGTGLTVANLVNIKAFKGRLFFAENNKADVWYGAVGAVTGALTKFQLSQYARGGFCQAIGTWSRDAGDGADDLIAFVFSTGEVIVYAGTDPATALNWSMVGQYRAAPPIGRRCLQKLGGELVLLTTGGYMPLSVVLAGGGGPILDNHPIWGKIRPAARDAAKNYSANFGWQIAETARRDAIIINVPISTTKSEQYVVNAFSGAWCRYTSTSVWPICWATLGGTTYVGERSGRVLTHSGQNDRGGSITVTAKTAFSYMGDRAARKRFSALRPIFSCEAGLTASLGLDVDFSERTGLSVATLSSFTGGGAWDTFAWDTTPWGGAATPRNAWVSFPGIGRCAATRFELTTSNQTLYWFSTQFMGLHGGAL